MEREDRVESRPEIHLITFLLHVKFLRYQVQQRRARGDFPSQPYYAVMAWSLVLEITLYLKIYL
jgi:hypothetical protein